MAPRRRGRRSLRRRPPRIDERKRLVVFCEGEVTEPAYLTALERFHGVKSVAVFDIREVGCTPRSLDERAKKAIVEAGEAATDNTEYWCVFDVEAPTPHPRL